MSRDAQQVLRERARALARPLTDDLRDDRREVLRWSRGGQGFALELSALRAVGPVGGLAAVPRAAPPLAGMVAFRGGLLPAYDPRSLLGASLDGSGAAPWALVVDDAAPFALLADGAPQIQTLSVEDLRPVNRDLPSEAQRCLIGVHPSGWVLLSPAALRSDPRLTSSARPEPNRRIETRTS